MQYFEILIIKAELIKIKHVDEIGGSGPKPASPDPGGIR